MKKKPLVVVTRKLPDSIETRMRELFDARINLEDTPMSPEQIAEAARTADVLVPTVTDHISADVVNQPDCKLRLIANFGNGVDNIDVAAAKARGIAVLPATGANDVSVAEWAVTTIMVLLRGAYYATDAVAERLRHTLRNSCVGFTPRAVSREPSS